jgi:hypothetical protein
MFIHVVLLTLEGQYSSAYVPYPLLTTTYLLYLQQVNNNIPVPVSTYLPRPIVSVVYGSSLKTLD